MHYRYLLFILVLLAITAATETVDYCQQGRCQIDTTLGVGTVGHEVMVTMYNRPIGTNWVHSCQLNVTLLGTNKGFTSMDFTENIALNEVPDSLCEGDVTDCWVHAYMDSPVPFVDPHLFASLKKINNTAILMPRYTWGFVPHAHPVSFMVGLDTCISPREDPSYCLELELHHDGRVDTGGEEKIVSQRV